MPQLVGRIPYLPFTFACPGVQWNAVDLLLRSFVTPPLHVEPDPTSRSAKRSLNFGRSRVNSDPVPMTSDPLRLSNHSCPDMSSYLEVPDGLAGVETVPGPVADSLRSVTPPRRKCCSPTRDNRCSEQLDRTLTEASSQRHSPVAEGPRDLRGVDESTHSRWSTSDYFRYYPAARVEPTGNRSPCHGSTRHQPTDIRPSMKLL